MVKLVVGIGAILCGAGYLLFRERPAREEEPFDDIGAGAVGTSHCPVQ